MAVRLFSLDALAAARRAHPGPEPLRWQAFRVWARHPPGSQVCADLVTAARRQVAAAACWSRAAHLPAPVVEELRRRRFCLIRRAPWGPVPRARAPAAPPRRAASPEPRKRRRPSSPGAAASSDGELSGDAGRVSPYPTPPRAKGGDVPSQPSNRSSGSSSNIRCASTPAGANGQGTASPAAAAADSPGCATPHGATRARRKLGFCLSPAPHSAGDVAEQFSPASVEPTATKGPPGSAAAAGAHWPAGALPRPVPGRTVQQGQVQAIPARGSPASPVRAPGEGQAPRAHLPGSATRDQDHALADSPVAGECRFLPTLPALGDAPTALGYLQTPGDRWHPAQVASPVSPAGHRVHVAMPLPPEVPEGSGPRWRRTVARIAVDTARPAYELLQGSAAERGLAPGNP